jgi:voltage-gated potassium channel
MGRRLTAALLVLFAVLVGGTIGYILIEGWGFLDALYMTTITIATVGFEEVHALSELGRIFTIVLVLAGVGGIAFSVGALIDFFVEGHLGGMLEGRKMKHQIEALSGHHIVAGAGRVGIVVARALAEEKAPFVVVDRADTRIEEARDNGWLYVHGDATEEATLIAAGIERASSLVTVLEQDADNLFVTVTAKTLNPSVFIVSRSSTESSEPKLIKAGANRVITPNVIGGRRMASLILHPFVSDYLDLVAHGAEVEYRLQELRLPTNSPIAGKSIRESAVRDRFGAFILAVRGPDGPIDTNPSFDRILSGGDLLVMLGTPDQLAALSQAV